jgi:D-glycero-D-manno-heptose 1,7-bisphosphate phosphatase
MNANAPLRKALFLDRDGVINVDTGYVHTPEATQWVRGIFDLCTAAVELGYVLVVVTNQAGIARGYYDEAAFRAYSDWQRARFAERGLRIEAIYHCPHHPIDGCDCRKPQPGMLLQAARELGLDLAASAMIGDRPWDIEAARRAGVGHAFQLGTDGASLTDATEWLKRKR